MLRAGRHGSTERLTRVSDDVFPEEWGWDRRGAKLPQVAMRSAPGGHLNPEIIVIGAGLAGLSCAQELAAAGRHVVILEQSRGVGGRCATRRVRGQPVDHGLSFFHSDDPGFLSALETVPAEERIEGWPRRIEGQGTPCQPRAFRSGQRRLAYAGGVTSLPKRMAQGLDVRLGRRVVEWGLDGECSRVETASGEVWRARRCVIALPITPLVRWLGPLTGLNRELAAIHGLLLGLGGLPCLTVLAGYPAAGPRPTWDVLYPEDSRILQLVSHDSSKRREPAWNVLVLQALPAWSRRNLDEPEEAWMRTMIGEAARLIGPWVEAPHWLESHRWRYARSDGSAEWHEPPVIQLPGGNILGLAGEIFSPGGGALGAWRSGRAVARRLFE